MEKAFVYGKAVEGVNFTDREKERHRLKMNFENGINVTLISPRRMGKTSLVKKVISEIENPRIKCVYMDIYDCRTEYEFLNRFAEVIMASLASKMEHLMENIKKFLGRLNPTFTIGADPSSDFSFSLGISPKNYNPQEILNLPEVIAQEKGVHIVVCIDEFQQIGEFKESLSVQKRLRGVWQHQQNVSYCLFGSKRHLMEKIFQSSRMPFYMFGEMMRLECIPTDYWVPFIRERFGKYGKEISEEMAAEICAEVSNYSSYVQQLAWNVMMQAGEIVTWKNIEDGMTALVEQTDALFVQQTEDLTDYQMNFLRVLGNGATRSIYRAAQETGLSLGTRSNLDRLKSSLLERELIRRDADGVRFADPLFERWFRHNFR